MSGKALIVCIAVADTLWTVIKYLVFICGLIHIFGGCK